MNITNIFQIIKKYKCKERNAKADPKILEMLNAFPILKDYYNYYKYEIV